MSGKEIEQEIQAKGLTASRVTPVDIEANIASEVYFTAADGVGGTWQNVPPGTQQKTLALCSLTFCVITLQNGFTVHGSSACASPENFNAEIGRKIARENAVQKIWPLMGYALKQRLHDEGKARKPPSDAEVDSAAERAFWQFDARRSDYAEWSGCAQPERDAFKAEARALARGHFPVAKDEC